MFPANIIFKYFIMLKNISNLGKTLSREEQKTINGGRKFCSTHAQCGPGMCCQSDPRFTNSTGVCGSANNNQSLCNGQVPFEEIPF